MLRSSGGRFSGSETFALDAFLLHPGLLPPSQPEAAVEVLPGILYIASAAETSVTRLWQLGVRSVLELELETEVAESEALPSEILVKAELQELRLSLYLLLFA